MNLLGRTDPAESRAMLEKLAADAHPDVAGFARSRLRVAGETASKTRP